MPGSNCTVYRLLVVPVTSHLNLTRLLVLLNGTLTPQPETSGDPDVSGSNGGAAMNLSSRSQDTKNDFQGAVKFTVAIVFLYGIGVILMLGFHIKKSKWKESSVKDATRLVRKFDCNKSRMDRKYHKTRIENLVRSIHTEPLTDGMVSSNTSSTLHDSSLGSSSGAEHSNMLNTLSEGLDSDNSANGGFLSLILIS